MAKLTLAQQLAAIAEPTPIDFDPEDAFGGLGGKQQGGADDDDPSQAATAAGERDKAARAEYVDVGQSKLRKRGEAVLDPKYGGQKSSRAALYGAGSDDDDDGEEEDDEERDGMDNELADLLDGGEQDDEEDYESEGDAEGFEDLEAAPGSGGESDGAGDGLGDSEDDEDEEEEEEALTPPPVSAAPPKKVKVSKDDKAMIKQLKQAASADVEKGRDVKKQLAFADSLLSTRIALQKAVQASNSLPTPASAPPAPQWFSSTSEVRQEVDELWGELMDVGEELFELRTSLLDINESLSLPPRAAPAAESRKRKRMDAEDGDKVARDEWLMESLKGLKEVEELYSPYLRTTITKWSDKVLAASGLLSKSKSAFKAVNQNAMAQIDHALSTSTGERERLVKRTRVRRTEGTATGGEVLGRVRVVGLEGEEKKEVDAECFDDSDWYAQVLRDVVESRMLDLDDATLTSLRSASLYTRRNKKNKKQVDTRASKGRKIRYHVHEKAVNWMIPVEAAHWHDEQIDELFASLLGRSFPQSSSNGTAAAPGQKLDPALDDVAVAGKGEVQVGSLRLF
ncbi:hypothetical protein JCM11641_005640 [Rhodosporidiobolus odoratus]